ncbi:type VI secretion system tube protein Hcp [Granulicella sp. L60]|uniref:type VI secretion system tube protein Hcp n=1 Tax=Granulicella sp. L60 TaxID=1641866 RepID=UPI00131BEFB3|nr:type VI secretion system tube protein Hcp [Granulicella sp. L60]
MASESSQNWWAQIPGVTNPDETPSAVNGQVEVIDFNLFLSATSNGIGKAPAKPMCGDCALQLKGDAAAGMLFKNMISQQSLGSITVTGLKTVNSTSSPFFKCTFQNCYTTSLSFQEAGDGGLAIGSFSFAYSEVTVETFVESKTGTLSSTGEVTYTLGTQKAS